MTVKGRVTISLTLNVYDLDTHAIYTDEYGKIKISDGDQFFMDWCDCWEQGAGELLGTEIENEKLEEEE